MQFSLWFTPANRVSLPTSAEIVYRPRRRVRSLIERGLPTKFARGRLCPADLALLLVGVSIGGGGKKRDGTADYSNEMMHAALDINAPNYANAIVTTKEIVDSISSLQTSGVAS
jgi:hypothetical protein